MKTEARARTVSQVARATAARRRPRLEAAAVFAGPSPRVEMQLLDLLPHVRVIARRIHRHLPSHVPIEDLYQAGVLGLLDALRRFDPRRRVRIESYMKFRIRGAILDELRSLDWSPRQLRRKARRIEDAHQELRARLGREPAHEELAAALHISVRQLEEVRTELGGLELGSLQEVALTSDDGVEKDRASLVPCADSLGPQAIFARQESRERLAEAIGRLPEKERQVLTLYYYEELTMKEVGEVLSVGESRISQIHSSALERLRGWTAQTPEDDVRAGTSAPRWSEKDPGPFPSTDA